MKNSDAERKFGSFFRAKPDSLLSFPKQRLSYGGFKTIRMTKN